MIVHLFGAGSSPGCANFGLKRAADDGEHDFGTEATIHRRWPQVNTYSGERHYLDQSQSRNLCKGGVETAPKLWNELPLYLRRTSSIHLFKKH